MAKNFVNVSPDFIWLAVKNTDCALIKRPNGVGDLTSCSYNPVGIQNKKYSAFANVKHIGVTPDKSGNGYFIHHQRKRNSYKPSKFLQSTKVDNLKSKDVENFRKLLRYQLSRRDLLPAVIRKANRIAFTQNRSRKQLLKSAEKKAN